MTATLQGLPAELLLHIIESITSPTSVDDSWARHMKKPDRKHLFMTLRATCVAINAKIVYFFASRCLNHVIIPLSHDGLLRLQKISQSRLHVHVQRITITAFDLFEPDLLLYEAREEMRRYSADSDAQEMEVDEFTLNEGHKDSVVDGSCGRTLAESLVEFHDLKAIYISPPAAIENMRVDMGLKMLKNIRSRWAMTAKVLLQVVFAKVHDLETFAIDMPSSSIGLPMSALDMAILHWPNWLSSLKKVKLHISNDLDEGMATLLFMEFQYLTITHSRIVNEYTYLHTHGQEAHEHDGIQIVLIEHAFFGFRADNSGSSSRCITETRIMPYSDPPRPAL